MNILRALRDRFVPCPPQPMLPAPVYKLPEVLQIKLSDSDLPRSVDIAAYRLRRFVMVNGEHMTGRLFLHPADYNGLRYQLPPSYRGGDYMRVFGVVVEESLDVPPGYMRYAVDPKIVEVPNL